MMRSDGRIQQYSVSGKTGTDGLHTGRQGQKSHSKAEMCSTFLLNTAASCSFFNIMDYSQIKSRAHYLPPVYKKNTNASFKDGVMRRSCFSLMLRTCGDGCCGRCHVGNSVWRWSRWGRKPRRRKLGKKKRLNDDKATQIFLRTTPPPTPTLGLYIWLSVYNFCRCTRSVRHFVRLIGVFGWNQVLVMIPDWSGHQDWTKRSCRRRQKCVFFLLLPIRESQSWM